MIAKGLKLASLFAAYGAVGYGGDRLVALLADELDAPRVAVEVPSVRAQVRAEIDVQSIPGHDGPCAYEAERDVSIPASASDLLRLSAGSGELTVHGRQGLAHVRAVARACASDPEDLEELRLTLERVGGDVVLAAHYPDRSGRGWGDRYARLDLAVEVPLGMAADIDDSSGSMEVSGTGETRIDDSSGSILAHGIDGALFIDDSSGEVEVADVAGDVDVEDGSGEILVRNVRGTVRVRDGSGSIDVVEVERDVIVDRDGSGSISVRDVRGDFSVLRDGSGGIRYSGVAGAVDIPRDKRQGG